MLYCFCEHPITRSFGSSSYSFRPWKIKYINLSSSEPSQINTPNYHPNFGTVVIECNPHLSVDSNGSGKIYYTAGFTTSETSHIKYYICSMNIQNFDFGNLLDFQVLYPAFTGIRISENEFVYANKKDYMPKDKLVKINIINNETLVYDIVFDEILRLVTIYGSDQLIVTGRNGSLYQSYLLNNNFTINSTITNNNNEDIYKCSLLSTNNQNLLAYTLMQTNGSEDRSIVIENRSI